MSDAETSKEAILRQSDLFQNLTEEYLDVIASCSDWATLEPNDVLFHEGDRSESMYVLESGSLIVERETRTRTAKHRLHPNAYLGVLTAAGQQPRMVTAYASGQDSVKLLDISAEELRTAMKEQPKTAIHVYDHLFQSAAERVQQSRDIVQTMLTRNQ